MDFTYWSFLQILLILVIDFKSILSSESDNGWVAPSSPLLPRKDYDIAVASYNTTIFLFGGLNNNNQLTLFNTITQNIIDGGQDAFAYNIYGSSQYYTQIGGKFQSVSIDTFQIYNISSNIWIIGSSMQQPRRDLACIVHPTSNSLYAIGGWMNNALSSVEKILIGNITNQHWQYIENLTYPSAWSRAVVYKESILVIGANYDQNRSEHYISLVQRINATNGQIGYGGCLKYALSDTAAIIVGGNLYVFGGWSGESLNTWQYLDLLNNDTNDVIDTQITCLNAIETTHDSENIPGFVYIIAISMMITIVFSIIIVWLIFFKKCTWRKRKKKDTELEEILMMDKEFQLMNSK